MSEPAEKLHGAAKALTSAFLVLKLEQPTIEAFLEECRDMENFGPVLRPTLYNSSERRAISALIEPLFKAAAVYMHVYETHCAEAKAALARVST